MAISKVPAEVLAEIFHLLCKKSILLRELNNSYCKEDFPWAVGLVCRQWRTAFLSYPPIWASLKLSDGYYDTSRIQIPVTRSESYAKEINRRLALYLERSGEYPLTLDILLWSDHNKSFTMMALEMLSACSHRWQNAKFWLFRDWPVDGLLPCKGELPTLEWLDIRFSGNFKHTRGMFEVAPRLTHAYFGPWAKHYGWILPWTQLTALILRLNVDSVIENGDVPNLLPMLHNIKELRFRFDHADEMDFEGGFPQIAPTSLNQLRILEVPHPAFLSLFEAPSLCEIYFVDLQQDYYAPLDVHGEISSLIQRSSCRIRKLSFRSSRKLYVGTLEDVEELVIDYPHFHGVCSSIDISSLPNLRLLTIICSIGGSFDASMSCLTTALKSAIVPTRSERSSGTHVSLLERVIVGLHCDYEESTISKRFLEIAKETVKEIAKKIADEWPVVVVRTQRSEV
ncbi:hypothetical protein M378DRAFT_166133 [Amanita muscaria Koide BX008]|uniref:F-box domain-containing protein n=1 Tax=Amanita muscaria (strain Koide BX008) TaxID=946122 RepID=A0A0C2X017_AMAMK|nr:hypothetical protein M378DRAFT_166133 [Amanita muscaria Koide BX008]